MALTPTEEVRLSGDNNYRGVLTPRSTKGSMIRKILGLSLLLLPTMAKAAVAPPTPVVNVPDGGSSMLLLAVGLGACAVLNKIAHKKVRSAA